MEKNIICKVFFVISLFLFDEIVYSDHRKFSPFPEATNMLGWKIV